jgi:phenylacetaldehyde dehydrogenase
MIGGRWVDASDGGSIDVINPGDGTVIARVPAGTETDIDNAVIAARSAFDSGLWPNMLPSERARLLWRLGDLIDAHADELAELETLDNGKPIMFARHGDIPLASKYFRYWAGWCTKVTGRTETVDHPGEWFASVWREPVGVEGLIIPWNYPLAMAAVKLGPALAAGCTTVLKPAEQSPLTAIRLGELIQEAGFPDGVVNIVTGHGHIAGAALAQHRGVDKISFTGSTDVGKMLLDAARGNLKRLSLELGGKSPTIVLEDADIEAAAAGASLAIFTNSGQMCAAGSRLLVAHGVFDKFMAVLSEHALAQKIGNGLDPSTTMGPLISDRQQRRVLDYIAQGRSAGASVLTGGEAHGDRGYFVKPTVMADIRSDMSIYREEIFGPVVVATPFYDLDEAVRMANDTDYGLAANIWTNDNARGHRLARRIRAGMAWLNCYGVTGANLPFGGFKQSGWGREGGIDGIEAFTEVKTIVNQIG